MMNFALGEWLMLGSRLVATGVHALGVGLVASFGGSAAVMIGIALLFSRMVLGRMVGHPLIALIMVTRIIVGAVMIGVLESVAAGYLDPIMGGGFSTVASYLVLLATLMVRPYGLFGRPEVERV
jgi:branched-chain amino acid transport system permease protein